MFCLEYRGKVCERLTSSNQTFFSHRISRTVLLEKDYEKLEKNLGLINYEKMKQWIKFKLLCFGSNIRKPIFLYCNGQERFAA